MKTYRLAYLRETVFSNSAATEINHRSRLNEGLNLRVQFSNIKSDIKKIYGNHERKGTFLFDYCKFMAY
jgi:hypothetical protein